MNLLTTPPFEDCDISAAVFSQDNDYRYALVRSWAKGPRVCFIMLNPSTADASINDPTINRCISFAKSWGFGSLEVVNLFAYRASKPAVLKMRLYRNLDIVGPENLKYIWEATDASKGVSRVVAAWGAHAESLGMPTTIYQRILALPEVYCLGKTKHGHPKHPLYVKGDVPLELFK